MPQAYYNKNEGIDRLTTETGAGQWGSSLAFACTLFDIKCKVFMVKVSYDQKPYRRSMMHIWGGDGDAPAPRPRPRPAGSILAADPDCPGSLGIAISEAVEAAVTHDAHQVHPGQRAEPRHAAPDASSAWRPRSSSQLAGDFPDVVIGCVGGGSNFAGLAFPFLRHRSRASEIRFIACEPNAAPP